jgi:phospholipase/carboxylesterase
VKFDAKEIRISHFEFRNIFIRCKKNMMNNLIEILEIQDWTIRCRQPEGEGPHPVVWLFHGWMGDEDSMWIFASLLPEHFLILAPRAPLPSVKRGYTWYPDRQRGWPSVDTFLPAIAALTGLMESWPLQAPWADFERFRLAGFSQGAALAYAFALLHPQKVQAVAGLAGFLPKGAEAYADNPALKGLPVYVSHGTKDEMVPVAKAQEAVQFFHDIGAEVTFCESDVGHKLSVDCFKGLEAFFDE